MNIDFTSKELQVIELLVPNKSAEATVNKVVRDWFNSMVDRTQWASKTPSEKVDEIIQVSSAKDEEVMLK